MYLAISPVVHPLVFLQGRAAKKLKLFECLIWNESYLNVCPVPPYFEHVSDAMKMQPSKLNLISIFSGFSI